MSYGAYRPAADGGTYWRTAHFLFPFWVMPPIASDRGQCAWCAPGSRSTTSIACSSASRTRTIFREAHGRKPLPGGTLIDRLHPNTTDWLGRYRMVEAEENDYFIDRDVQRDQSFTGIEGIHVQDQASPRAWGRSSTARSRRWRQATSPWCAARRCCCARVEAFQKGKRPPAADDPEIFANVRGGYYTTRETGDWLKIQKSRSRAHRRRS